jgi:hypothetical protein
LFTPNEYVPPVRVTVLPAAYVVGEAIEMFVPVYVIVSKFVTVDVIVAVSVPFSADWLAG